MQIVHTHTHMHTENMRQTNMHMWVPLCACVYSKFSPHRYTLSSQCKQTNVRHVVVVVADFFLLLLLRQLPNCLVRLRCHKQQRDTQKSSQKRIKNVTEREKEKRWQVRCSDCSWTELNSKSVAYLQAAAHSIFDLQSKSNASWMHVHLSPSLSLSLSLRMCAHTRRTSLRRKKPKQKRGQWIALVASPGKYPNPKPQFPLGICIPFLEALAEGNILKLCTCLKYSYRKAKSRMKILLHTRGGKNGRNRYDGLCSAIDCIFLTNLTFEYVI